MDRYKIPLLFPYRIDSIPWRVLQEYVLHNELYSTIRISVDHDPKTIGEDIDGYYLNQIHIHDIHCNTLRVDRIYLIRKVASSMIKYDNSDLSYPSVFPVQNVELSLFSLGNIFFGGPQ